MSFLQALVKQCKTLSIPISDSLDNFVEEKGNENWELIVDAIFGFSFQPPIRAPFDKLIPVDFYFEQYFCQSCSHRPLTDFIEFV